jgi:hypothetical protein
MLKNATKIINIPLIINMLRGFCYGQIITFLGAL